MDTGNNILNQLKKKKKPKVPAEFFNNFADELMQTIEMENSVLNQLPKNPNPKVPANFFDTFADKLPIDKPQRKGKIVTLKRVMAITAIAASLLLLLIFKFNNNSTYTAKANEQILNEQSFNDVTYQDEEYLSYLTEDDLIDYIVENEIEETDEQIEEDKLFDELEYELDDYIYEL